MKKNGMKFYPFITTFTAAASKKLITKFIDFYFVFKNLKKHFSAEKSLYKY